MLLVVLFMLQLHRLFILADLHTTKTLHLLLTQQLADRRPQAVKGRLGGGLLGVSVADARVLNRTIKREASPLLKRYLTQIFCLVLRAGQQLFLLPEGIVP